MGGAGSGQPQEQEGLDASDLLAAGMAFLQSRQEGDGNVEAIMDAVLAGTQMSGTSHRQESGKLVANTLFNVLGPMLGK
jgi:hypothetical protein